MRALCIRSITLFAIADWAAVMKYYVHISLLNTSLSFLGKVVPITRNYVHVYLILSQTKTIRVSIAANANTPV